MYMCYVMASLYKTMEGELLDIRNAISCVYRQTKCAAKTESQLHNCGHAPGPLKNFAQCVQDTAC